MLSLMGFMARPRRWRAAGSALAGAGLLLATLSAAVVLPASTAGAAVVPPDPAGTAAANAAAANPGGKAAKAAAALPTLPNIPLTITDGVSAQKLLTNAVMLSSVGIDTTALQAGLAAVQQKLDADSVKAEQAQAAAAVADQRAAEASHAVTAAQGQYHSLDGAVKNAVLFIFTSGPSLLTLNPAAGDELAYAADYADTTLTPSGVLANRRSDASDLKDALREARKAQKAADKAAAAATSSGSG